MDNRFLVLYYFIFAFAGFFLSYLYGRHTKDFRWREYVAMLIAPILGTLGLTYFLGFRPIEVFLICCFVGPALEWLLGIFYHKTIGARLWIYERYPWPGGYTSFLAMPIWGIGLVFIWLFLKLF